MFEVINNNKEVVATAATFYLACGVIDYFNATDKQAGPHTTRQVAVAA